MNKSFRLTRGIKSNLKDTLFLITIGVAMAWAMVLGVTSTTEFTMSPMSIFFQVFLVVATLRFIFINKYTILFTLLVFITSVAIVFIDFLTGTDYAIIHQINSFVLELMMYLNGLIPHSIAFENTIILALNISFAIFIFIFSYVWFNFFILFIGGFILFSLVLTSGFFDSNIAFYTFIFTSILYLIKYLNRDKKSSRATYLLYTVPIAIFSFVIAFFVPVPESGAAEQVAETFITRPFNTINIMLQDHFRPKYFSLAQTGFGTGDMRRLGGNVVTNYNIVMRVRSKERTLYLTGAILDTYTGYAWVNQFTETYELYFGRLNLERIEQQTSLFNVWSIREISNSNQEDIISFSKEFINFEYEEMHENIGLVEIVNLPFIYHNLVVDTLDNRTFSIFHTGVLVEYNTTIPDNVFVANENGTITSRYILPRNTTYYTTYIELSDLINTQSILQNSFSGILQETFDNLSYEISLLFPNGEVMSYADILETYLIPRSNWIREIYTQLPEHLPQRVIDLAHYVTYGATNDYERARKLEAFLRTFYYTLSPGNHPSHRDFVDYFLFDLQKGYCTYYASAFVVMARALGMPTRYVEGFIAVGTGNSDNYIYIRNRQGHAWADVYFEGFGWYRFDPTPPSDTFGTIFASTVAMNTSFDWATNWGEEHLWWDYQENIFMATSTFNEISNNEEILYLTPAPTIDTEDFIPIQNVMRQSILIVIGIVVFGIIARVLYIIKLSEKTKNVENNVAVKKYFDDIIKHLEILGWSKKTEETALDFAKRVNIVFSNDSKKYLMTDITQIFLKAKYSQHTISNKEREIIEASLNDLETRTKEDMGKTKYFAMKYILATV